jgi:hypothetical protein
MIHNRQIAAFHGNNKTLFYELLYVYNSTMYVLEFSRTKYEFKLQYMSLVFVLYSTATMYEYKKKL